MTLYDVALAALFGEDALKGSIQSLCVDVNEITNQIDDNQYRFGRTLLRLTFNESTIVGYIIYTNLPTTEHPIDFILQTQVGRSRFLLALEEFIVLHANDQEIANYAIETYV